MLRLHNLFFTALTVAVFSFSVHAEITPITETLNGTRSSSIAPDTSGSDTTPSGCGADNYPYASSSISCSYNNAKDGRGCVSVTYCKNGSDVTVQECPSSLAYSLTDTSGITSLSSLEYCDGYKGGVKAVYFYENPELCSIQGITDTAYLSNLVSNGSCSDSTTKRSCSLSDGTSVDYCELSGIDGYQPCPNTDSTYSPYPHSDCGIDSDEDAIICYTSCGSGRYCAGYTCDTANLPDCEDLEQEKIDEGYFSSGISSYYDADKGFIHQCTQDGAVKYIGFYCQGYYTESDCTGEANNGTIGDSCSYITAAGTGKTVYQCSCGDWQTLSEYCKNDAECMTTTYGYGSQCWLDSANARTRGVAEPKYATFRSTSQLCSVIYGSYYYTDEDQSGIYDDYLPGGSQPHYVAYSTEPEEGQCLLAEDADEATTVYVFCTQGCYKTEDEMQVVCNSANGENNSTPDTENVCRAFSGISANSEEVTGKDTYCGCTCDATKFKSKEELCEGLFSDTDSEEYTNCLNTAVASGECHSRPKAGNAGYYDNDVVLYSTISCPDNYKTKEKWLNANPKPELAVGYTEDDYVGLGVACIIEKDDDGNKIEKYKNFGLACPVAPGSEKYVKDTINECQIGTATSSDLKYSVCYKADARGIYGNTANYVCACPISYGTTCADPRQARGGTKCEYDKISDGTYIVKYANCNFTCGSNYASVYADTLSGCPAITSYTSYPRLNNDGEYEKCTDVLSEYTEKYICACPSNFMSVEQWCEINKNDDKDNCISQYKGIGTSCNRDLDENQEVVVKYTEYAIRCPTDKPLYYSAVDCESIGGEVSYTCLDNNSIQRVVCSCPANYYSTIPEYTTSYEYDEEGNVVEENQVVTNRICESITVNDVEFETEPSGNTCDFDGTNNLKYEQCIIKCSSIYNTDNNVVKSGAYTYLSSADSTPTQTLCTQTMGNGAVLGYGDTAYCSSNNSIMYMCYCPASFQECKAENNEVAALDATICVANGTTYYSKCSPVACEKNSANTTIVDNLDNIGDFGPGAKYIQCSDNGTIKYQVTCDTSVYSDPCAYPYTYPSGYDSVTDAADSKSWCAYSDDASKNMADNKVKHFKSGVCRVRSALGACGSHVIDAEGQENSSYTIFVASTESECQSKYGPGISTQLCEYGKEQGYKRAYNCYYDASEFKYTTANCGVRHDLTGNYIIIKGKKYWNQCLCTSAYQYHKFNCGGILSGNPCQQEITQSMIDSDTSLAEGVADGYDLEGAVLPYYPYCECSSDYTEICDEDGSGRYKGVGTACNGKYTACECVPDKLPDNWTDNYYGCAGGKKPTGVWKDNGCGQKYYQCTVVECTWEYTEMCEAPLIPVGQSCQDNEGNIGGYKACTCPSNYKVCPTGQVGVGEPCNLKGVSYYTECKDQENCDNLANETCTGALQIGINPCTRGDVTYFESCVCANGYDKVCGEGEVGVGNYCEINGTKYYKECIKPEDNECTDAHITACDTNQESYSPCVGKDDKGKQIVKYLCHCPTNWKTSAQGCSATASSEVCVENGVQYYSECSAENSCSAYQELTYQVCTAAQTGDGGSCSSTTTDADGNEIEVVKYATCKDSGNCLTNGFRYSCSGYDASVLGESCVDDQGNKLYKECPCPSNYVTCGNSNATKGSQCTPLLADGSFGTTVYSSCECDKSKYKYTCKSSDSNKGITAPSNASYCEVDEQVYVYTTDEDGNSVIKTDEDGNKVTTTEKVKYYSSCDCGEDYLYTCDYKNGSNGAWLPEEYANDFCKINSTVLYKACGCDPEIYTETEVTCKASNALPFAASTGDYCQVKGKISYTSGDETTNSQTGGTTYYKSCACPSNYTLSCDGIDQSAYGTTACTLNNVALYPSCSCDKSEYSLTCTKSGYNQGIQGNQASGSLCTAKEVTGNGTVNETSYYNSCTCENEYRYECEAQADPDAYDLTEQNYCDLGSGYRKYTQCLCDSTVFDTNTGYTAAKATEYIENIGSYCSSLGDYTALDAQPSIQFCQQINSNGTSTYYANRNICCENSNTIPDGYTKLNEVTATSLSELETNIGKSGIYDLIAEYCGHGYNGNLAFNCNGDVYYKCANDAVKTAGKYTDNITGYLTQTECTNLSDTYTWGSVLPDADNVKRTVKTVTINKGDNWIGAAVTLKDACDCNSSTYQVVARTSGIETEENECQKWYNSSNNNGKLFCTSDVDYAGTDRTTCNIHYFKFNPLKICTSREGYKASDRCVCKRGSADYTFTMDDSSSTKYRISNFCGDPYSGDESYSCWITWPGLNGNKAFRVSTMVWQDNKAYNCPTAYRYTELRYCSGSGVRADHECPKVKAPYD